VKDPWFPELGFYGLPGHVSDPSGLLKEVEIGEQLGLGSVWISERLNVKNVEVLSGVAAAATRRMGIASGLIANINLRHPLVVASYGATMSALTGGRFALGFGRGVEALASAAGVAAANFELLGDYVALLRRLWRGERVNYEGVLGRLTDLAMGEPVEHPPPLIMAAMGERTCYWAGRHCDAIVFNSLWGSAAVARSARIAREGAADAGRDPARLKIWTILVTSCEVGEEHVLNAVVRRINTYLLFPPMFDVICDANGWPRSDAERLRRLLKEIDGKRDRGLMGDESTSRKLDDLRQMLRNFPSNWIDDGCAVGTATQCAAKIRERLDAGADGVLIHGSTPDYLHSLLAAWPAHRPKVRFDGVSANPGC
jgi:5,10-methylenetetrahydromethanopterin reductase